MEARESRAKYSEKRRTEIVDNDAEINEEDMIQEEE